MSRHLPWRLFWYPYASPSHWIPIQYVVGPNVCRLIDHSSRNGFMVSIACWGSSFCFCLVGLYGGAHVRRVSSSFPFNPISPYAFSKLKRKEVDLEPDLDT